MEEKNESAEEISIRIANEFEEKLEKHFKEYMDKIDTSNLKPFDIQKAKEGKPVCSECGRIVFDEDGNSARMVPGKWHGKFPKRPATEEQKRRAGKNGRIY